MKSKILLILMSIVLIINIYDLRVFANTNVTYDHEALMQYDGYGKAMYETVVEQTSFITGQYTDNKEYVSNTVGEIKDYANFWYNDYVTTCDNASGFFNCLGEIAQKGTAYMLTVGDWIKNLFTDYDETVNPIDDGIDFSMYDEYFDVIQYGVTVKTGYFLDISFKTTTLKNRTAIDLQIGEVGSCWEGMGTGVGCDYYKRIQKNRVSDRIPATYEQFRSALQENNFSSVGSALNYFHSLGGTFVLKRSTGEAVNITRPPREPNNKNINNIKNYINDSSNDKPIIVPQPKAYLSCPDGTQINMAINGGTFLNVKGEVMQVSHDGTASVDSQICNLGWEKPTIQYIDDRVGITTPDGDVIDAETGEILQEKPFDWEKEFDDEIEDGCGVVCIFGKLLKGLGEMAKALFAIPKAILDGLLDLLKKLFVPTAGYWDKEMNSLKDKFFNKEIEKNVDAIKDLGNASGGAFQDVQVSIMGVSNVTVVDSTSINSTLDTIHSWVRGFFYPLLLFFNISMLYRLIRGTSFVGIGRNGEGGGDK